MTEITAAAGVLDRAQRIALDAFWGDRRYDYAGGSNVIYVGCNVVHDAAQGDTTWVIWKYTYDGDNVVRTEGPVEGSWTGRADLGWGA